MSDYVSRQYLLNEYDRQHKGPPGGARKIIAEAPAEDVAQVVMCKDCKHVYCRIYHGWQEPIYTCTHLRSRWNINNDLEVNPDDFCSYGERKED